MSTAHQEDLSSFVLRRMKEGGFDFARIHPIEFYAIFPDEERARRAAGKFCGESLNAQINVGGYVQNQNRLLSCGAAQSC